jgi:hypothetical protein
MKKELNKGKRKLTLGKMTVAKLQMSQRQMQLINGGEDTKPKPPVKPGGNSFANDPNNPCVTDFLTISGIQG